MLLHQNMLEIKQRDAGCWILISRYWILVTESWFILWNSVKFGQNAAAPITNPISSINLINYSTQSTMNSYYSPTDNPQHTTHIPIYYQLFNRIALAFMDHSLGNSIVTVAVRSIRWVFRTATTLASPNVFPARFRAITTSPFSGRGLYS